MWRRSVRENVANMDNLDSIDDYAGAGDWRRTEMSFANLYDACQIFWIAKITGKQWKHWNPCVQRMMDGHTEHLVQLFGQVRDDVH